MSDGSRIRKPVLEALKEVKYPGYSRDIVSFGLVRGIKVEDGKLIVQLGPTSEDEQIVRQIADESKLVLQSRTGFRQVEIQIENPPPAQHAEASQEMPTPQPVIGVDRIIAISSGKGGVGKSTIAANLACTAAQAGLSVGLLDADIYGPSLPVLFGFYEELPVGQNGPIPIEKFGVKAMSIGFLIEAGQPLIWRGPLVNKALEQLLKDTQWGHLDILFLDLPPGTGDVQLTLAQKYQMTGAVVVTTPQDIALSDVRRGTIMFQTVNVPVLGVIENMSYYRCSHCGDLSYPFGKGGGEREAQDLGLPLLGQLPLDPRTREQADAGVPIVIADPRGETTKAYIALWEKLSQLIQKA
ncbi:MAG TPA: Mrp/NBP35 family ATP-binding protein [bacterium]|jgi:ATP-binding protein involved in chromosome partitioning